MRVLTLGISQITPMKTEAFLNKNRGASHGTEKQEVFEKSIMINRIRSNIQTNYTFCDIIRKPTAKQIAFLEELIMSPAIEDKEEYRFYYRILKAEEAMLSGQWDSISSFIFGEAENGAIVLKIGQRIIPKPIQYRIAISLYTDKGDMYDEIVNIVKNGREHRPNDWDKEMPECVRKANTFTVYRAGKESIDKAVDSLSWTLWRDVAEWFAERHEHYGQEKQHLYKATISADDVIAFTNSRREFEIIQYGGVRDIEELPRIGVSAEYKELFSATSYDFHKDQENRTTALDLFAKWYRQNNAMGET